MKVWHVLLLLVLIYRYVPTSTWRLRAVSAIGAVCLII